MKRPRFRPRLSPFAVLLGVLTLFFLAPAPVRAGGDTYAEFPDNPLDAWWQPGSGDALSDFVQYRDPGGTMGIVNAAGWLNTQGHPFFEPLGGNGRACVSCHQPSQGMSLAAANVRYRWQVTKGQDPLFSASDGSNCPSLPQAQQSSHSLLLDRGLIRVALPWPRHRADGKADAAQFTIAVANDPTGCNSASFYGPAAAHPALSVYRRPRVVANFPNPAGGCARTDSKAIIMADGRARSLKDQAVDAGLTHLEMKTPPSEAQLQAIVAFECQIYAAQSSDGLDAFSSPASSSNLGPENMRLAMQISASLKKSAAGDDAGFQRFDPGISGADAVAQGGLRASIARGEEIFSHRTFSITGAMGINTGSHSVSGTCASCHDVPMSGMSSARFIDTGSTNQPWAISTPDLPLFKVTCSGDAPPHPFLGRVIFTQDPGRALVTGKCADVGAIMVQQLRGLAARAPYFSNGSAATLADVVNFYDRRFSAHYTTQEKQDLVNFLGVL
jgi:cytochrome c peroxidase